ncbi:2-deoxy-D-gluconate 3-dehydrogenase, N-ter fragment [Escherichia coli]|uniref:2-deoxy-D-gluconate 3-dehydrogenase, N-ter n=1 Tax=Escherichia coli TaxID=562 RepID=A0A376KME5_ECOLX|nr:2-deoxy-D-gluconate 3-dehydrogenase, N-ter fragment [Escherichia coli]
MILSAFSLEGKVAVVTGCDTGLGQGMALGLAQAGCDIVGINIVEPTETIKQVTALGRRFLSLTADLRKIDGIPALLDRAVAEFGHIDILVNNAGLIRREDALRVQRKRLGRCHEPEYPRAYSSCLRQRRNTLSRKAMAARLSISRQCSPSRAGSVCLLIPHQKAA